MPYGCNYSMSGRNGGSPRCQPERIPPVAQKKHQMFAKRYFQEQGTGSPIGASAHPTTPIEYEYDGHTVGAGQPGNAYSGPIEGATGPQPELKYSCSVDFSRHQAEKYRWLILDSMASNPNIIGLKGYIYNVAGIYMALSLDLKVQFLEAERLLRSKVDLFKGLLDEKSAGEKPVAIIVLEGVVQAHIFFRGDLQKILRSRPELAGKPRVFHFSEHSWIECASGFTLAHSVGELGSLPLRNHDMGMIAYNSDVVRLYTTVSHEELRRNHEVPMDIKVEDENNETSASDTPVIDNSAEEANPVETKETVKVVESSVDHQSTSNGGTGSRGNGRAPKIPYLNPVIEELRRVEKFTLADELNRVENQQCELIGENKQDALREFERRFKASHPEIYRYVKIIHLIGLTLKVADKKAHFKEPVMNGVLNTASTRRIFQKLFVQWKARRRGNFKNDKVASKRVFRSVYPNGNYEKYRTQGEP